MRFIQAAARILLACFMLGNAGWAAGQGYPDRPIRMIASAAGGASDFAARLVAQGMSRGLNQQVIVDNRGGGVAAIEIVAKAPPDGYMLLYYGSIVWLLPMLQDAPYEMLRDFMPVSLSVSSPVIITVHPSLPVKSVKDLIALAKARPGDLNYGSGGTGSTGHMAAELFKSMAGVNMVRVAFRGSGPALAALISGELQVVMSSAGGLVPHIQSGRVRALAVTSAKRASAFPNLPTVKEAGLPEYEYGQYSGIFAPAQTPPSIVDRLSREAVRGVQMPDIREKFEKTGVDVEGSTPQEFTALIRGEISRLGKVIKEANIRR